MPQERAVIIGGVDCHSRTHHAVAVDDRGHRLGDAEFPATLAGYQELYSWLAGFGPIEALGVESTSSYGAGLTRWLTSRGVPVLEVNQPHKHTRSRKGKSDPVDAEAAARKVLAGEVAVVPKDTAGVIECVRQLRVAREGALKARSAALCQLGDLLVTAPAELRESLPRKTLLGKARLCARFRPNRGRLAEPLHAAKFALRSLALRIAALDEEIGRLDRALEELVRRTANRTLHMVAVVRLRYCPRTRAYAARRSAEGLSKREIIRCLERYIAREVYRTLSVDLRQTSTGDALDAV